MSQLTIGHVVPDISSDSAGPTYSVTRLCEELSKRNHSVELHTLEPPASRHFSFPVRYYKRWRFASSLGISPAMRRGLAGAARRSAIIHSHGMWMMPSVYPGRVASSSDARFVFSPEGMLEPWALSWSRHRKKAFWIAFQKRALAAVDCIHATSDLEADAVRQAGFGQPIAVIPIGIDLPTYASPNGSGNGRSLLYLGRLHPKKNLELLLKAWADLHVRHPDWHLTIAGGGATTYEARLRRLAAEWKLERTKFIGPAYGSRKEALFRAASLYALPTHSENFGITVAEALSFGVPVITTSGTPWVELAARNAGWCTSTEADDFLVALDSAMNLSSETLSSMGLNGREWMRDEYNWELVGGMTEDLYGWLSAGGSRPSFVK